MIYYTLLEHVRVKIITELQLLCALILHAHLVELHKDRFHLDSLILNSSEKE